VPPVAPLVPPVVEPPVVVPPLPPNGLAPLPDVPPESSSPLGKSFSSVAFAQATATESEINARRVQPLIF
jgi:hypothetical protein